MWTSTQEYSDSKNRCRIIIHCNHNPMAFADVINGWQDNPGFRRFYISLLADLPFEAIFWEAPPITLSSVHKSYEFVAVHSPRLSRVPPDTTAFKGQFASATADESVIAFENLGGDALLVVPRPLISAANYSHLMAFVRRGPAAQVQAFFRRLGEEITHRVSDKPLWVSTSGLGVYWLHARLDSRPKYYTYSPLVQTCLNRH